MGTEKTLLGWLHVRLARALVTRQATPLILTGTLALAGLGAAITSPATAHQSPSPAAGSVVDRVSPALVLTAPHTFCEPDPDGDGHTICHVLPSQVDAAPTLGCFQDPDGDGTFICYYASDPTATN